MDDVLTCPICNNKLRNNRMIERYLPMLDKKSNFIERTCTLGHNHSLTLFVDEATNKVDWVKVSLTPQYSRFIEINYVTQKCKISCLRDGKPDYIEIDKLLEPDFPDLTKLKERVGIYVIFS